MGNKQSSCKALSSSEIEEWYAARAAEHRAQNRTRDGEDERKSTDSSELNVEATDNLPHDNAATPEHSECPPSDHSTGPSSDSGSARLNIHGSHSAASSAFGNSVRMLSNKVKLLCSRVRDACADVIETVKKLGIIGVAKKIGNWMKAHPVETAAIIITVAVLASMPPILSAMGFTASGIAAASTAAAIQSGIGNVVAGSAFAILQSAMMGGYGIFIFVVCPALAGALTYTSGTLWKIWKGPNPDAGGAELESSDGGEEDDSSDSAEHENRSDGKKEVLVNPSDSTVELVKDILVDAGQAAKLGAILVVATGVYWYRRRTRAREE